MISTAGVGSCISFSDSADTPPRSWGSKPGKHCANKAGARILQLCDFSTMLSNGKNLNSSNKDPIFSKWIATLNIFNPKTFKTPKTLQIKIQSFMNPNETFETRAFTDSILSQLRDLRETLQTGIIIKTRNHQRRKQCVLLIASNFNIQFHL